MGLESTVAITLTQNRSKCKGFEEKRDSPIDHAILRKFLYKKIADHDIMWLIDTIIAHSAPGMSAGKSVPIGNLTSQHFGNVYLDALDHFVKDCLGIRGYLRYMDDFLLLADDLTHLLADDLTHLQQVAQTVRDFAEEKLLLALAPGRSAAGVFRDFVPGSAHLSLFLQTPDRTPANLATAIAQDILRGVDR